MPRDLSDVLHYFLPELAPAPDGLDGGARTAPDASKAPLPSAPQTSARSAPSRARRRVPSRETDGAGCPLAVLGIPLGERELVHAVYALSVALEAARQGARVVLLSPAWDAPAIWPTSAWGATETIEVVVSPAVDLAALAREAQTLAVERGRSASRGGVVVTRIPSAWLDELAVVDDPIRWLLFFGSARRLDVDSLFARLRPLALGRLGLDVGLALVGPADSDGDPSAYDTLAGRCERELSLGLAHYGVLADDLDVCRAIAAGAPIACDSTDTPVARSIAGAARLVYQDARSRVLG